MPKKTVWLINQLVPLGLTDVIFNRLHHSGESIVGHHTYCKEHSSFSGPTNVAVRKRLDYIHGEIVARGFSDSLPDGLLDHLADVALRHYPLSADSETERFAPTVQPAQTTQAQGSDMDSGKFPLDEGLLTTFMTGFYGYGNPNGDYWFIGMEEGGGNTCAEVGRRLQCWDERGRRPVEDLADFHEAFGERRWFIWRELQPTWSRLISLLLTATSKPNEDGDLRHYQVNMLGRSDGATCLLEFMPLPSPTARHWLYSTWTAHPSLSSRETYLQAMKKPRAAGLTQLLGSHRPRVVIFYGLANENLWTALCPAGAAFKQYQTGGNQVWKIAHYAGQTFVICAHPATGGLSPNYFKVIGRKVRECAGALTLP